MGKGGKPVFISLGGAKEEVLLKVAEKMGDDLKWGLNISSSISKTIKNIEMSSCLRDFFPFIAAAETSGIANSLNKQTRDKIFHLKESLLGLYNKYFDIDSNFFSVTYGGSNEFKAVLQRGVGSGINSKILTDLFFQIQEHDKKNRVNLFDKLVNFQILDFVFKTDPEKQRLDLTKRKLFVPTVLANTPISLLAALYENLGLTRGQKLVRLILEKARSPEELAFIAYIFLQEPVMEKFRKTSDTLKAMKLFDYVIQYYIQEKLEAERIFDVYKKNRTIEFLKDRIENVGRENAVKLIVSFVKEALGTDREEFVEAKSVFGKEFPKKIKDDLTASPPETFSLSKLLMAHTRGEGLLSLLEKDDLAEVKKILKQEFPSFDLGKITQSVEAGSEKNPIQGTIVECLQNSIDAGREWFKTIEEVVEEEAKYKNVDDYCQKIRKKGEKGVLQDLASIRFMLETMPGSAKTKSHFILTMRDYAGFPHLKTLLTAFILPDFSLKAPSRGNVGDMGNGSFKIYQNAEKAFILTRMVDTPEKFYLLIVTPKRNKDGMVVDLDLACEDISVEMKEDNPNFWGTSIRVVFKEEKNEQVRMNLIATKDFLQNCVGATQAQLKGSCFKCYLKMNKGEELLNPELSLEDEVFAYPFSILSREDKEQLREEFNIRFKGQRISDERVLFRIRKRKGALRQSYVTTSGLPFRPFSVIAKNMNLLPLNFISTLSNGYVFDFDLSTYQPVQSRTELQINDFLLPVLRQALFETMYIVGLRKVSKEVKESIPEKEFLAHHFTHFNSETNDFHQLKLSDDDNTEFQDLFKKHLKATIKGVNLNGR